MVLGVYYLTDFFNPKYPSVNTVEEWKQEVPLIARFNSKEEAYKAFQNGEVDIKDKIVILEGEAAIETTVGRVIFNMAMPTELGFINETMGNKAIKRLISRIFDEYDMPTTVRLSDDIKDLGFKYSTIAAISINITDMKIPKEKEDSLKAGDKKSDEVLKLFYKGYFSEGEKHRMIIDIRTDVKKDVEAQLKPII